MPIKMIEERTPGIVLAAFGIVEPTGLATYESIQKQYERAFPGCPVRLAFTSKLMRDRLREKDSIEVRSPLAALADLHDSGIKDAVVQSLQIVPGEEFHRLAVLVQSLQAGGERLAFHSISLGLPLLSSLDDCRKVSGRLSPVLAGEKTEGGHNKKTAVVLMGHGTGHPADSLYSQMASVLRADYENVFLHTLEGFPGIVEMIPDLKRSGFEKVRLLPFLLVAGGHVLRDMAGEGQHSWKSILERNGFEVDASLQGLAESEEIISLFLEHTRMRLETMKNRSRRAEIRQKGFESRIDLTDSYII